MRWLFIVVAFLFRLGLSNACSFHSQTLDQRPFYSLYGLLVEILHLPIYRKWLGGFLTVSASNARYGQSFNMVIRILFSPDVMLESVEFTPPSVPFGFDTRWYPWPHLTTHVIRKGDPLLVPSINYTTPFKMPLDRGYCLFHYNYFFYFLTIPKGRARESLCICTECLRQKIFTMFMIDQMILEQFELQTAWRYAQYITAERQGYGKQSITHNHHPGQLDEQESLLEQHLAQGYYCIATDLKQKLLLQSKRIAKQHFSNLIAKLGHRLRHVQLHARGDSIPLLLSVRPFSLIKHDSPFLVSYKSRRATQKACPERDPVLWDRLVNFSFYDRKIFINRGRGLSVSEVKEPLLLFVLWVDERFPLFTEDDHQNRICLIGVELSRGENVRSLIEAFNKMQIAHEIYKNNASNTLSEYKISQVFAQLLK